MNWPSSLQRQPNSRKPPIAPQSIGQRNEISSNNSNSVHLSGPMATKWHSFSNHTAQALSPLIRLSRLLLMFLVFLHLQHLRLGKGRRRSGPRLRTLPTLIISETTFLHVFLALALSTTQRVSTICWDHYLYAFFRLKSHPQDAGNMLSSPSN